MHKMPMQLSVIATLYKRYEITPALSVPVSDKGQDIQPKNLLAAIRSDGIFQTTMERLQLR